jgi:hypothetical protein
VGEGSGDVAFADHAAGVLQVVYERVRSGGEVEGDPSGGALLDAVSGSGTTGSGCLAEAAGLVDAAVGSDRAVSGGGVALGRRGR